MGDGDDFVVNTDEKAEPLLLGHGVKEQQPEDDKLMKWYKSPSKSTIDNPNLLSSALSCESLVCGYGSADDKTDANNNFQLHAEFEVKRTQLVVFCGAVGSGKSTLLACLAKAVSPLAGNLRISADLSESGNRAYVPQVPFLLNATIRENILFNDEKLNDEVRYGEVLDLCCLRPGFAFFFFERLMKSENNLGKFL